MIYMASWSTVVYTLLLYKALVPSNRPGPTDRQTPRVSKIKTILETPLYHETPTETYLSTSIAVMRRTSLKGMNMLNMRKISIILMYAVLGRELDTPIDRVVMTNKIVTFTVTTASNSSFCN